MTLAHRLRDVMAPTMPAILGFRSPVARRWLPVAMPGLAMLGLGLFEATRPVLSWDEIATADVAHRTAAQIGRLLPHIDGVFGPYYLLLHFWTTLFGASVLSLRLPSILAMAGAVALTGELGRRLFGVPAGLLAGLLLCLVPNMSRYAAEARPYAMVCFFSVLALLLLHRVIERPSRTRWAWYGAAVLAVGLSSIVALAVLSGHLALLLVRRRGALLFWCAIVAAALTVLSPLIWWGLHQRVAQLHWVTPVTLGAVYNFPARLAGSPEVAWLLIGLFLAAAIRPADQVVETAAVALVPMVVVLSVSVAGPSFWVNRYLLLVLIPAAMVAAAALTQLVGERRRWPRLAAALGVFAAAAVPGQLDVRQPNVKNGSDYRTLAAVIQRRQLPGDDIVLEHGRTMRAGLDYYLRGDHGRPHDALERRTAAQTGTLIADEYPDTATRLAAVARIWLVAYGHRADPATVRPDLERLLHTSFRRSGQWAVKNGTMALYIRRSAVS
jgi:mannosyltransferase